MTDVERIEFHREHWNVYERGGYLIAITAAVRLATQSGLPIIDIAVGAFHGGEYVLHVTVPDEYIATLPNMLEQRFEGFRVAWLPSGRVHLQPPAATDLNGVWRHADDDTDAEFTIDTTTTPPRVEGRCISDGEELLIKLAIGNVQALLFASIVPSTGYTAEHMFVATGPGIATQRLTLTESWKSHGLAGRKTIVATCSCLLGVVPLHSAHDRSN